jgi:hypothetical protein
MSKRAWELLFIRSTEPLNLPEEHVARKSRPCTQRITLQDAASHKSPSKRVAGHCHARCPFRGQKRRFDDVRVTSAFPLIADVRWKGRQVRKVPQPDSCTAAIPFLFDHLIRMGDERRRHGEALLRQSLRIESFLLLRARQFPTRFRCRCNAT